MRRNLLVTHRWWSFHMQRGSRRRMTQNGVIRGQQSTPGSPLMFHFCSLPLWCLLLVVDLRFAGLTRWVVKTRLHPSHSPTWLICLFSFLPTTGLLQGAKILSHSGYRFSSGFTIEAEPKAMSLE